MALGLLAVAALQHDEDRLTTVITTAATVFAGLLGASIPIVIGFFAWQMQENDKERRRESDRIAQRHRIISVIRAEIELSATAQLESFHPNIVPDRRKKFYERVDNRIENEPSLPIGLWLDEYMVFDQHKSEMYNLPKFLVKALVRYYKEDMFLIVILKKFESEKAEKLSNHRKKSLIDGYFKQGNSALLCCLKAKAALYAAEAGMSNLCEDWATKYLDKNEAEIVRILRTKCESQLENYQQLDDVGSAKNNPVEENR